MMREYLVKTPLKHDGVLYRPDPDDEVRVVLGEKHATPLLALNAIAPLHNPATMTRPAGGQDDSTNTGEGSPPRGAVNINTATAEELAAAISGVGDQVAQRIVDYREAQGPFERVDHLTRVQGIGKATLAAHKDGLTV